MSEGSLAAALREPGAPVPAGLSDGRGRAAGRRFAIYRNNVVVGLAAALEAAFPVVARLVGRDFFGGIAREFLHAHPPRGPRIALWGDAFPGFLEAFPPASRVPYLPDVARLEHALRESYHAADARAVDPEALQLAPERLVRVRLRFAPSVRLVRSRWPVASIWRANAAGGPRPRPGAEDVLVARPGFDPVLQVLAPPSGTVAARLMAGDPIGVAASESTEEALSELFGLLIQTGAIAAIEEEEAE